MLWHLPLVLKELTPKKNKSKDTNQSTNEVENDTNEYTNVHGDTTQLSLGAAYFVPEAKVIFTFGLDRMFPETYEYTEDGDDQEEINDGSTAISLGVEISTGTLNPRVGYKRHTTGENSSNTLAFGTDVLIGSAVLSADIMYLMTKTSEEDSYGDNGSYSSETDMKLLDITLGFKTAI